MVEVSGCEVDGCDAVLGNIFTVQLQLAGHLSLLPRDRLLITCLAVLKNGRDEEQVSRRSGKQPLAVRTCVEVRDRTAEARKESLGIWADILEEPDASVHGADGKSATQRRGDLAEVNIVFVHLFLDGFADAWVKVEECLVVDADKGRAGVHLSVFRTVGYVT